MERSHDAVVEAIVKMPIRCKDWSRAHRRRALNAIVEVDEGIPSERCKAVARVIRCVMRLRPRGRAVS